jgi:hypothetical protein
MDLGGWQGRAAKLEGYGWSQYKIFPLMMKKPPLQLRINTCVRF